MRSDIERATPNRIPSLVREIVAAKKVQDRQTQDLGSEKAGTLIRSDPDQLHFLTPGLKNFHMIGVGSPNVGVTTTLGYMPESQNAHQLYAPVHDAGTTFGLDRAGTANTGVNVMRTGQPPIGYVAEGVAIEKRVKKYFRKLRPGEDASDDVTFRMSYDVETRQEAKGYGPQEDEQYGNGLYLPSAYLGVVRPYGLSFPTGDDGEFKLNPDPWGPDGWTGTVVNASGPTPSVDSVSPDTVSASALASNDQYLEITGSNFTGCSWVLVGPFHPVVSVFQQKPPVALPDTAPNQHNQTYVYPEGAYYYRYIIDDNNLEILCPHDVVPGQYDIIVIGSGGSVGRLKNGITVVD